MPPCEASRKFLIHRKILRNLAQESINKLGFRFFIQGMFLARNLQKKIFKHARDTQRGVVLGIPCN